VETSENYGRNYKKRFYFYCEKISMPETYQRGYIDKYITRKYNALITFLINNKGNEKGNFFQLFPDFCIWKKKPYSFAY